MTTTDDDRVKDDRAAILEQLRKQYPGGQIPASEFYLPDHPAKSMQGPMEVVKATFANCKVLKGH
jgi:hypothetical protein